MIFDKIENASRYYGISERITMGLNAIPSYLGREPGKYEIDGDNVFILVQHYNSFPSSERKWEAHHRYIDIQYIEEGCELIGFDDETNLVSDTPYTPEGEAELFTGEGLMIPFKAGDFAVFFTFEPHKPCVAIDEPTPVKKIIVKVKAE